MKLTKTKLKQIIREEIQNLNEGSDDLKTTFSKILKAITRHPFYHKDTWKSYKFKKPRMMKYKTESDGILVGMYLVGRNKSFIKLYSTSDGMALEIQNTGNGPDKYSYKNPHNAAEIALDYFGESW